MDVDRNLIAEASTQTLNISNLTTKSVTLYPTRAHVTRQIDNVSLKPGANEVIIYGLSPTVDEHSIQIESQGSATIVDMTVELVPNREIFEETYPDDSESSEDDSEPDIRNSDDEEESAREISQEIKSLRLQITEATETQNSASERLMILNRYSKSATAENLLPDEMVHLDQKYGEERASIFKVHTAATLELEELRKQVKRKENEKFKRGKQGKKQERKIAKQKAKDKRRKGLQLIEKRKEAYHAKQEKLRYWAKKVYKITLLLDASSFDTPGSSRRSSMDSITLASSPRPDAKMTKSPSTELAMSATASTLLLSYVTKEAGWSPRYDIRVSSLQKMATIIYRTEFLNRTSETWTNAKLSFSTSQTSYQGLDDAVPFMHSWRIRLSRYPAGDGGLLSAEEAKKSRTGRETVDIVNRAELFGREDNYISTLRSERPLQVQPTGGLFGGPSTNPSNAGVGGTLFNSSINRNTTPIASSANPFGRPATVTSNRGGFSMSSNSNTSSSGLFGSATAPNANNVQSSEGNVVQANTQMDTGIASARGSGRGMLTATLFSSRKKDNAGDTIDKSSASHADEEDETSIADPLDFEESSWEDNGLTTTYDVPGIRTLAPSSITRRHKIASLHASNIHLSHVCVPKLRSAAFLRAKIRNPSSSVTLLKGSAGVTLDGSFLGNMKLPRVSPGQMFELPLGVDPAVHVNYPKPSVHRSTQGIIFSKESAQVFIRSIWLNNTRPQPVDLLVLDQIPVSEDERLRVAITTPRGLMKEGDSVKAGAPAKEGSSGAVETAKGKEWGSAVAKLKKNGEVNWTVKLEKGQGCLLKLEYEARLPPDERIAPA